MPSHLQLRTHCEVDQQLGQQRLWQRGSQLSRVSLGDDTKRRVLVHKQLPLAESTRLARHATAKGSDTYALVAEDLVQSERHELHVCAVGDALVAPRREEDEEPHGPFRIKRLSVLRKIQLVHVASKREKTRRCVVIGCCTPCAILKRLRRRSDSFEDSRSAFRCCRITNLALVGVEEATQPSKSTFDLVGARILTQAKHFIWK
mmetsp:Transcript_18743/g.40407  ORF Transcript_18743/g.40407 Transcript_18743/m.40407 type:complete len:204 (-) Transcript_18743:22-633(-)